MVVPYGHISFDRMVAAVEDVQRRMVRAASALEAAGIPYAIIGGNAIAAWVSRVDTAAVRNTRDVDILIHRSDLAAAKLALEPAGFVYHHVKGIDMFLDGPGAKARDAVHVLFANEKVRGEDLIPAPDLAESELSNSIRVLSLSAMIRMKLTSYRSKDKMHLLDLIDVGLVDQSTVDGLPSELAARLQEVLDNPDS